MTSDFWILLLHTYCCKGNDFLKKIVLSWSQADLNIFGVWPYDLYKSIKKLWFFLSIRGPVILQSLLIPLSSRRVSNGKWLRYPASISCLILNTHISQVCYMLVLKTWIYCNMINILGNKFPNLSINEFRVCLCMILLETPDEHTILHPDELCWIRIHKWTHTYARDVYQLAASVRHALWATPTHSWCHTFSCDFRYSFYHLAIRKLQPFKHSCPQANLRSF